MSLFHALCSSDDEDFDECFFEQLNSQTEHQQNLKVHFFVPAEARELFSQQEIAQRQLIADQWFSQNQRPQR